MVQHGMERKFLCLKGAEADVIGVTVTVLRVLFWLTTKGKWSLPHSGDTMSAHCPLIVMPWTCILGCTVRMDTKIGFLSPARTGAVRSMKYCRLMLLLLD